MINGTGVLKAYAKIRNATLAAQNPAEVQRKQLFWLLNKASKTQFGKEYNFPTIRSVEEFQKRVPLRTYDDFWNQYWKSAFPVLNNITWPGTIPYYCWTSGTTTGTRKYIPYSRDMTASYNRAGADLLVHHVTNRPKSQIFGGKNFMLGGSTHLHKEAEGVFTAEVSGVTAKELPWWARLYFYPPRSITDIADWTTRMKKIAEGVQHEDVRLMGGMPSWTLIFLEQFKNQGGVSEGIFSRLFPNIEMFVHGGVKFEPYIKQYQSLLAGTNAELREVYPASEAFIAVADRGFGDGLRIVLDSHVFYEFVPVDELKADNPTRHWIGNVVEGVNYAIVLNSPSGMWGYVLGDTVRFVDTKTPRILITGRTSYSMSAFGEHLILEEVEKGVLAGIEKENLTLTEYCLGAKVSEHGGASDLGHHVYLIECASVPGDLDISNRIADAIDKKLLTLNDDYADHRAPGCGLMPPKVYLLKPGSFAAWMASRGKLGDQFKVPKIMSDTQFFNGAFEYFHTQKLFVAE